MAAQHDEHWPDWYDANKDSIKQPVYGWEISDYLVSILPDTPSSILSFHKTRGELDENEEGIK